MTSFERSVLAVVRAIPAGKVMSYGQVAAHIGLPRSAREVGWAMASLGGTPDFPWWRVLNNKGEITIKAVGRSTPKLQQELLEREGIEFVKDLELDIDRYRYSPA